MLTEKQQNKNIILALITLVIVIGIVALIGYLTLGKSPEYIQGQAESWNSVSKKANASIGETPWPCSKLPT